MNAQQLQFNIQDLRTNSIQQSIESIFVVMSSLFVTALLPSLMVRYFYQNSQLLEQPKALEYIPVAAFVISAISIVATVVGNAMRYNKIRQAQASLTMLQSIDADDLGTSEAELKELERIVDSALKTKTPSAKKTVRLSAKKTKKTTKRATSK